MSVSPPTLPKYISAINTICEGICKCGVIPRLNPTVPTADAASYRQEDRGRFSYTLIKRPPPKKSTRYIVRMVAAVLTASQSTLRPKNWTLSRWRKVAITLPSRTVSVVVFIPPAVEPGEPPMSIRKIITAKDELDIPGRLTVLKPAVLGVTDWNSAA